MLVDALDAHAVVEGEEEIGKRGRLGLYITSGLDGSAAAAGQQDGQVGVRVAVAVSVAGTVHDHGVMEQ